MKLCERCKNKSIIINMYDMSFEESCKFGFELEKLDEKERQLPDKILEMFNDCEKYI